MRSYLTTLQVAELTGKHPETIRRWCRTGKIKSLKKGLEFLIPASEFEIKKTEDERNQDVRDFVFGRVAG